MSRHGKVGAAREASLARDFYTAAHNFTPEHLHSLSFQVQQIRAFEPARVLEVGIGNGFVSTYLRQHGIEVLTADINPALGADIVAPLAELPQQLAGVPPFDLVSCCEVLEHMPLAQLDDNLRTLASLARHAFISLPGHWPWLGFSGRFGLHNRFVNVHLGLRIPNRRRLTDGHYWEIHSEWATRRSALIARMRRHFDVVEAGVFPMNRYHYFFRCQGSQHLG